MFKEVVNIFPIPICVFEYQDSLDEEIESCLKFKTYENKFNKTSFRTNVLNDKKFQKIRSFVQSCIDATYANVYVPKQKTTLRITQSWFNYTNAGERHHEHAHANSFLSGVMYFQANDNDTVTFFNTRPSQLQTPTNQPNMYNSSDWNVVAKPKTLYIFPSWLPHCVQFVDGEKTRISLAFNTFPKGKFGDDRMLTGLRL